VKIVLLKTMNVNLFVRRNTMFRKFSYLIFVLALSVSAKAQTEEPIAYFIDGNNIIATASSQEGSQGPENTVNGSGLDANDGHSTSGRDMWISNSTGSQPAWIQYEFDKIYVLREMWAWNHNNAWSFFGAVWGCKDVTIEYSVNSIDWTTLGTNYEFAKASGESGYAHNTTIDFEGIAAKYVKLTINSNWEVLIFTFQYGLSEVRYVTEGVEGFRFRAHSPSPVDGAIDISLISSLDWTSAETAVAHDVYFGIDFNDVNEADRSDLQGILVSQNQNVATYDPGHLDFEQIYYWRVDEVNDLPDSTIFKGDVWSFTAEPFVYPVDGNNIIATASSQEGNHGPENTVNGSGLDVNDLHSDRSSDAWLMQLDFSAEPQLIWIQYEFDKIYKFHEMWVWNYNEFSRWGCKDVTIEYSVNSIDWTTLGTNYEFAQAPGESGYAHNTTIDFEGIAAKYVKLTINSNWGGYWGRHGLSEVRFFYTPTQARKPSPGSGETDVDVDIILSWRAGRDAAEHDVYLSDDEQAVIDSTAPVIIVTEASCSFLLDVNSTYYWRVDEVNDAETITIWQGEIWNFSTQDYFVVDDFESYNDLDPNNPNSNRIFDAWIDGFDDSAINGSIIQDSNQSMSYFYDNNFKFSEAELTLNPVQNWTEHSVAVLVLYFRGEPSNAVEQMYLKVNGLKMLYDGDASDILQPEWRQWSILLEEFANQGVDLQNITQLSIGFGDEMDVTAGGSGMVYFDDIRLYRSVP